MRSHSDFDPSAADDQMPGIVVSSRMLTPEESIKVPGTQVDVLLAGVWVGPFTVTGKKGRTHEHLVLSGPNGMFETYNDFPFNIRAV